MWGYTPRQLNGYMMLASARRKRERAAELSLATMAARAKPDVVKKQLRELDQ